MPTFFRFFFIVIYSPHPRADAGRSIPAIKIPGQAVNEIALCTFPALTGISWTDDAANTLQAQFQIHGNRDEEAPVTEGKKRSLNRKMRGVFLTESQNGQNGMSGGQSGKRQNFTAENVKGIYANHANKDRAGGATRRRAETTMRGKGSVDGCRKGGAR
jgi:hypothetical protein